MNEQAEIAAIFGIPAEHVQVICPFIGGAFGTSLRTWPHVTLAAIAARQVGRAVKLVLTRKQMFFTTGHRPRTLQRVALGATRGRQAHQPHPRRHGRDEPLRAVHGGADFGLSSYMYSCPNVRTRYRLRPLDIGTPNHMRGPGEASGIFALECAMDELSYALGIDPIELRRRNEPAIDEGENKPFSSRSLMQCYDLGAERFGWSRRIPAPRSMRDGRLLIGMGAASATYPAFHGAVERAGAAARGRHRGGRGRGERHGAGHLHVDDAGRRGDARPARGPRPLQPRPVGFSAGAIARRLVDDGVGRLGDPRRLHRRQAKRRAMPTSARVFGPRCVEWARALRPRRARRQPYREIVARDGRPIEATASAQRDPEVAARYSMHAFGAVFAEVADRSRRRHDQGAPRASAPTASAASSIRASPASQCTGGMIGGIGMALMERTVLDPRDGRPVNAHMADYLVPVNLDIRTLEAHFVEEVRPARQSARR